MRMKSPSDHPDVIPHNRLLRAASIWLSINFFQAISQVSGLSQASKALHGEWHYVVVILASFGFISLMFVLFSLGERSVEFLAARSAAVGALIGRALAGALVSLCVAAPFVQWWAVGYADRLHDMQPSVCVERTHNGAAKSCASVKPGEPLRTAQIEYSERLA